MHHRVAVSSLIQMRLSTMSRVQPTVHRVATIRGLPLVHRSFSSGVSASKANARKKTLKDLGLEVAKGAIIMTVSTIVGVWAYSRFLRDSVIDDCTSRMSTRVLARLHHQRDIDPKRFAHLDWTRADAQLQAFCDSYGSETRMPAPSLLQVAYVVPSIALNIAQRFVQDFFGQSLKKSNTAVTTQQSEDELIAEDIGKMASRGALPLAIIIGAVLSASPVFAVMAVSAAGSQAVMYDRDIDALVQIQLARLLLDQSKCNSKAIAS